MKSRISYMLMLFTTLTAIPAQGQVTPLGKVNTAGGVRQASCSSCDSGQVVSGFYDGAIWGTSCGCSSCDVRPGLFPPCPNPCNTTLLGDVVCDVKVAVDNGLSHLFGSLFGALCLPCGCRSVCSCDLGGCDVGCSDMGCSDMGCSSCVAGVPADFGNAPTMTPTPASLQPTPASTPNQPNPFVDDPPPSARLKPIPPRAARRVTQAPRFSQGTTRAAVHPVSYESQVALSQVVAAEFDASPAQLDSDVQDSQPLAQPQSGHYLPRRSTSLRQSNGTELKLAPLRSTGTTPALRFREAK